MFFKFTAITFLFGNIIFASVSPNPFLRPGANRKPPPVIPVFKTKPIIRPDVAKELEFKGYFILNDQIYFSLFNKKVNHGEWITISEKTYEDFSAESFDIETEILTILYEGQSFDLKLLQSKSSSLPNGRQLTPSLPKPIPGLGKSASPKVMPPKPKSNPVIPSFLVNKSSNNSYSGSKSSIPKRGSTVGSSRSMLPGLPYPGFVPRRNIPSNPRLNDSTPSSVQANNPYSSSIINSNESSNNLSLSNEDNFNLNEQKNDSDNSEIDLNSLPPPPPPPNILPPSPPPNIIPSREE